MALPGEDKRDLRNLDDGGCNHDSSPCIVSDFSTSDDSQDNKVEEAGRERQKMNILSNDAHNTDSSSPFDSDGWIEVKMCDLLPDDSPGDAKKESKRSKEEKRTKERRKRMSSKERSEREMMERGRREMERTIADLQLNARYGNPTEEASIEPQKQAVT
jgi:hypothetical protein